jgi:hypothetical protein
VSDARIDRLVLRLPAGSGPRGGGLARRVAEHLAGDLTGRRVDLDRLAVGPVPARPGDTDAMLARRVADAVVAAVDAAGGRGWEVLS